MEAGELPAGWLATTLGEVASWSSGGTPSRSRPEYFQGNIPWIKSGELGAKYIRDAEESISETAIAHSSAKVFPKGAVGIAMYGATIGKLSIWGIDASTNQACAVGVCGEELNNEFLYYFLASEKRNLIKAGKGGAQPNISQGVIREWPFNLPPLAEQHRIVAKIEELFSELDQGVASLKTAREQLKVYRQSLLKNAFEGKLTAAWRAAHRDQLESATALQQRIARERQARYQQQLADWQAAGQSGPKPKPPKPLPPLTAEEVAELPELPVGWGWVRLEALISRVDQGWSPKCDGRRVDENEWAVIKTTAIQHGRFDEFENKALPPGLEPRTQHELQPGDILVTRAGPRIRVGVCCLVRSVKPKLMNCDKAYRIRALSSLCSAQFLESVLNSPRVLDVLERIKSGINDSGVNLNQGAFLGLAIPFCGLTEQQAVVDELESKLSEADQLDQTLATALQQADALRQSILKKAFCGQLVAQDPNDEPATALLERIRAGKSNGMSTPRNRRKSG